MKNSRIASATAAAGVAMLLSVCGGGATAVAQMVTATSVAATSAPTAADNLTPHAGPQSVSRDNAREKALEYLDFMAFSRTGLIKQLQFEGFSKADATYGVDATRTNWYKQAALKAAEYLEYSSFSRSGLIAQLKFEGFTTAQATYGAKSVGF